MGRSTDRYSPDDTMERVEHDGYMAEKITVLNQIYFLICGMTSIFISLTELCMVHINP